MRAEICLRRQESDIQKDLIIKRQKYQFYKNDYNRYKRILYFQKKINKKPAEKK